MLTTVTQFYQWLHRAEKGLAFFLSYQARSPITPRLYPSMKKHIYALLLLGGLLTRTESQAQVTTNYTWTTALPAQPLAIATDGPRGAYVLLKGNTVLHLDAQGRERWRETYADWPAIQRIAASPGGELVLAGPFTGQFTVGDSTYQLAEDYETSTFVVRLDSSHVRRWTTYVITPDGLMSQPNSVAVDASGAVLAFGRKGGSGVPFLCRFDADGRFVGSREYGAPVVPAPDAVAMATNSQGLALLGIAERTKVGSSGVLALATDDSLYWKTYVGESLGNSPERSFDTSPLDLAVDRRDNTVVLSNYTLTDRTAGLRIENGQALLRFDASGKNTWLKTGVVRADSAVATGVVADPAGAFVVFGGYEGTFTPETAQYGPDDYISLAGYAPDGSLRWTTRLNAPTGNDRLVDVARAPNGALLLLGSTTGTLSSLSVTGTSEAPAYFLANLQPFTLQPTAAPAILCAGSQATLKGTYAGYFEQPLTLQLSDVQGSFANAQPLATVPIGVPGNLFSINNLDITIPVAGSTALGTSYRLRATSSLPEYLGEAVSVSIVQAPAIPAVQQLGDELVASTTMTAGVTYQWYTNSQQPVPGATSARFRPSQQGAYYVVAQAGGCASLASEALQYLLLASEPTVTAEVNVYPNPTTDRLSVRWVGVTNGQLELTDLTGRVLRQQPRTGDVTELSLRELGTGLYLLNLQADGQASIVRKVMVR